MDKNTASLPSRGAWIEITLARKRCLCTAVAPLAGSVDRNLKNAISNVSIIRSLPSRGAWIEMT